MTTRPHDVKNDILKLFHEGKSYQSIAESLGCSKGTISFHCSKLTRTVPVEPKSRASKQHLSGTESLPVRVTEKRSCLNCEEEFEIPKYRVGKYCCLRCSSDHRFNERYEAWVNGTIETHNRWLSKALTKLHGYACSECKISEWNGKPIVLEVEHKDGNSENNCISNLCLVCPNCHSQTPTYKARNRGNGRHYRRVRYAAGLSY